MSRMVLPKTHIDALLTAALSFAQRDGAFHWYVPDPDSISGSLSPRFLTRKNADEVGMMLWRANYQAAVLPEDDEPPLPTYSFEELPGKPDPLVILRAISSYVYQADLEDLGGFLLSEHFGFLFYLQAEAIHRLPGINEAPWVIDDPLDFSRGSRPSA